MELVNYFRIIRRRWRLVAAFLILGVLAGAGSAAVAGGTVKGPGPTYFLAKHTLSTTGAGSANLGRDAALCTEAEVPRRVAAKLGFDNPNAISGKIICEPHPELSLLYVAAADGDAKRAVLLADTFGEQLVLYLRDIGEREKLSVINGFGNQIDTTKADIAKIQEDAKTTTDPAQKQLDQNRVTEKSKQVADLNEKKNAALATPAASETLTTLSTADAVSISAGAYDVLVNGDPKASAAKNGSPTVNATRQSQLDAAVRTTNPLTMPTRGGLGGGVGLLAGFALAIVLDRIDPRIRTKFEAEEAFGWPVIGEIPPLTRRERQHLTVFAFDEPRSRAAESYRVLRSAVLFSHINADILETDDVHPIFATKNLGESEPATVPGPPPERFKLTTPEAFETSETSETSDETESAPDQARGQVIMVTSPGPSEGKTTTAANLAAILAETGRSVIVVNCDFRRPRIHLHLGAPNEPREVVDTKISNVKLVSQVMDNPNEANPAIVLQTQRQVIRNAREMFDVVLLDTAPLLTTNDATDVLSVADQVVIVVKAGKTHKEAADRCAELLERRNGPVLGVILVGAMDVPTSRYYYYGDSPATEEPGPGMETETPFEALLSDGPTVTPASSTSNSTGQKVFADVGAVSLEAKIQTTNPTDEAKDGPRKSRRSKKSSGGADDDSEPSRGR